MRIQRTIYSLIAPIAALAVGLTASQPEARLAPHVPAVSAALPSGGTFAPEVDTGGFFLYMPSYKSMKTRAALGFGGWVGDKWSDPDWNLVGFAHFTGDADKVTGSFWLASHDMTGTGIGPIDQMRRPGSTMFALRLCAPILYVPVPNGSSATPISKSDFIVTVNESLDTGGADAPKIDADISNDDFDLWAVEETKAK